jgi:hypothetical protein
MTLIVASVIGFGPLGADCTPPRAFDAGTEFDAGGSGWEAGNLPESKARRSNIGRDSGWGGAGGSKLLKSTEIGGGSGTKASKLIEIGGGLKNCLFIVFIIYN